MRPLVKPTIIVDTREQSPWSFKGLGVLTAVGTLKTGDYSVRGFERSGIVVERKSLQDLFGTMVQGRARFERELLRMRLDYEYAAVVVEASALTVKCGVRWTQANGASLFKSFVALCVKYGVAPVFADGVQAAEEMAAAMLVGFWRNRNGGRG